jgi:hypothetical protein
VDLKGAALSSIVNKEDISALETALTEVKGAAEEITQTSFHFKKGNGQWIPLHALLINHLSNKDVSGIIIIAKEVHS